ncbi:MAG: ABC transporter ATP-binding protein [Desulfobacteraceae bacterium]|jgi:lipopolysaccharide transport system ATP-binding protein
MNSSHVAVEVNDISKIYRIGVKEKIYDNAAQSMWAFIKSPLSNFKRYRSLYKFDDVGSEEERSLEQSSREDIIWALKHVSFDVKAGERLAVIGRNGAGKSTLLKILSRVTVPTRGFAKITGRISSLLEVGTGFHPELSGRENVYLNATILGMRKKEVDQRFDQIIDFSGIEKFIDTPVKRYSSGMKVRLAFSVAAHLEPEILIIDEVLAVGDADFQKKCLNKMEDVGKEGRTVIFVSHNMPAVTRLCDRAVLIEKGQLTDDGPAPKVVGEYLRAGSGTSALRTWDELDQAPGGNIAKLREVRAASSDQDAADTVDIRNPIYLQMTFDVLESGYVLLPNFGLVNDNGDVVFVTVDQDPAWRKKQRPAGRYISKVTIPGNFLAEGTHYVNCHVMTLSPDRVIIRERGVIAFTVVDNLEGDSARGDYAKNMPGVVRPLLEWTTEYHP